MNPQQPRALTIKGNGGILKSLISQVGICVPFMGDPAQQQNLQIVVFQGVWDTGATGSVITASVAQKLGLKPTGLKKVNTANGEGVKNTYLVNITLPNDVMIQHVEVTEGDLKGIDVLIGMDVITLGDFSITNYNGSTTMSFRIPSTTVIDYVTEINRDNVLAQFKQNRTPKNAATKKKRRK